MRALDEVRRLKEARRAELAAAEESRKRAAEEGREREIQLLSAAVDRALTDVGAAALSEHCAGLMPAHSGHIREVAFDLPGHRRIVLRMCATDEPAGWYPCSGPDFGLPFRWGAARDSGHIDSHPSLADALIAAEIEGWTPPVPDPKEEPVKGLVTVIDVPPAAQAEAAKAWPLVFAHGMPPGTAVDFVRETDCTREQAVRALLIEAAAHLNDTHPGAGLADVVPAAVGEAGAVAREVLAGNWGAAEKLRQHLLDWMFTEELEGDSSVAQPWIEWCDDAKRAIQLCRGMADGTG
jgi:hypothetical protein